MKMSFFVPNLTKNLDIILSGCANIQAELYS